MGHPFSAKEKEVITQTLLKEGRKLFGSQGLKKTSIAELAQAAGIAQGSFYSFFGSKEELLFAIMEEEENQIHCTLMQTLTGKLTRDKLKQLLLHGMAVAESNIIIRQLMNPEVYQRVMRKLPDETVKAHIERDSSDLAPIIQHWQAQGCMRDYSLKAISGLMRAVFTISLHKQEIGEDIFPEVMELLAEALSTGLVREEV